MEVKKIKHCIYCDCDIEPKVEFTDYNVIQYCPKCGEELGRAGAFFSEPTPVGIKATIKVTVK